MAYAGFFVKVSNPTVGQWDCLMIKEQITRFLENQSTEATTDIEVSIEEHTGDCSSILCGYDPENHRLSTGGPTDGQ